MQPGFQEEKKLRQKFQYIISRAEKQDEESLIQLLEKYVTTQRASQRYQWIYQRNPQGEATCWTAREPINGEIVGFTSIFTRDFLVAGEMVKGGIGFDAFVRPDHRRRGIVLALHRASFEDMQKGEVPFKFMCGPPVRANLDALVKAGSRIVGGLRYMGLPLNTRGILKMLHLSSANWPSLEKLGNFALNQVHHVISHCPKDISVRVVEKIDTRFDQYWSQESSNFDVIGRRDGDYLNWRYLENPVCWQQLVAIEQRGQLLGWAVLEYAPQGCLLVDYLLPEDNSHAHQALSALIKYVSQQGSCRLTLRFNPKGRYTSLFLKHGFLPGWSVEHLQVLCAEDRLLPALLTQANWHFSNGDLNPESSPWSVNTSPREEWASVNYHHSPSAETGTRLVTENMQDGLIDLRPHISDSKL